MLKTHLLLANFVAKNPEMFFACHVIGPPVDTQDQRRNQKLSKINLKVLHMSPKHVTFAKIVWEKIEFTLNVKVFS